MKKNRLYLIILALLAIGQTAWAQDEWPKTWVSGGTTCTLTADGVFTVAPTDGVSGAMADYVISQTGTPAPWFQELSNMKTVIISDGVTHVGDFTFSGFYYVYGLALGIEVNYPEIDSISIGNSVQSIGTSAFTSAKITSITIPDNVITIGEGAFSTCKSLTSIHIGEGVTTLGKSAFSNCDNVTHVYIGQSVTNLGEDCFELTCYNGNIECHAAPFTTWESNDADFTYYNLEERGHFHVPFANWTAWMAAYPNAGCIIEPNLDTEIYWTSGDCELNLDGYGTLTISGNGAMDDYATTSDCPWNNASIISKVNTVIVENGVTTLSNNGFTGFTNVTKVIFNGDVLTAWPSCATDFASTTTCYVNYSWTDHYTNALAQIHFNCGYGLDWSLSGDTLTISKTLPGNGEFFNYNNANEIPWRDHVNQITSVVIEDGAVNIGKYVFSGINASTISIAESVTHINSYAFHGSTTTQFTVPASVTTIDAYAFAHSGLTSFVMPSFMTEIPESLFEGSTNLTTVGFASGTTVIGDNAFFNTGLTTVDLPYTLTTIGDNAFANTDFVEITFQASLTSIGENAFADCDNVTNVYCYILNPNTLTWTSSTTDFNTSTNFHVITGTLSQWQTKFPNTLVTFVEDTYDPTQPFEIWTKQDWSSFCNLVRNVSPTISAKLMADLDLGNWINQTNTVGTESNKYSGIFEGNGHTLTFTCNVGNSVCQLAPFLFIENATIKNLHTAGMVRTGNIDFSSWGIPHFVDAVQYCSGLVSQAYGNYNQILNCQVSVTLDIHHDRYDRPDFCGGFVGQIVSGAKVLILNCLFDGTVQHLANQGSYPMATPTECGGFVGCNRGTVDICNSLFSPADVTFGDTDDNTFSHNMSGGTMNLTNSYYTKTFGVAQGTNVSSWSAWRLSSMLGRQWTIYNSSKKPIPVMTEHALTGEGTSNNPYQIANADDWAYFARMLNYEMVDDFSSAYFEMTDDISTFVPVGITEPQFSFRGHFEGNGHTLNVSLDYDDEHLAPFGNVEGATISNLIVDGTITASSKLAGGLVGGSTGNTIIQNCRVNATISSSINGDGSHGGIVGRIYGTGTTTIKACVFNGRLVGSQTDSWGGFVGWLNTSNGATVNIANSMYDPVEHTLNSNSCCTFVRQNGTISNSYYLVRLGTAQGKQARSITANENVDMSHYGVVEENNASGITTYSFDNNVLTGIKYNGVYYAGNGDQVQFNLSQNGETPEGYLANSFLATPGSISGTESPYTLTMPNADVLITLAPTEWLGDGSEASPWLIQCPEQWAQLCDSVNNHGKNYAGKFFKLMADITIEETFSSRPTKQVGHGENVNFRGTFDGNGHTMTINYVDNNEEDYSAPFRYIRNATIKNLHVAGSITKTHNKKAGGLVGVAFGTCHINNCRSSVDINMNISGDCSSGGFIGELGESSDADNTYFENCLFDGQLIGSSASKWGGFIGWVKDDPDVYFTNCLFNPTAVAINTDDSETFARGSDIHVSNCYYKTLIKDAQGATNASSMDNETLRAALGDAWKIVVEDEVEKVVPIMVLITLGIGSEDSPYLISSAEDWDNLSTNVMLGENYSGKYFLMTDDITVDRMVGTYSSDNNYKAFCGTFDGDGHTLTINVSNQSRFAAPFKCVSGATIKNLHTAGTIDGTGNSDGKILAGIVGVSFGNTSIIGCSSSASIITNINEDAALAGIVAAYKSGNLTVEGCVFNGSMTATNTSNPSRCGGIVGYRYGGNCSVSNSLFAPTALNVTTGDTQYSATIARTSNGATPTITNCYYTQILGIAQGKMRHSITTGENVTMENAGTATEYSGSGITSYSPGIQYDGVLYAGNGDNMSLNLYFSAQGYDFSGYVVSAGSLSGSSNPYTLTMSDADVIITADVTLQDWDGTGTDDDPYQIINCGQLNLLAARVNAGNDYSGKYFKVMNDLAYDASVANNYTAIGAYVNGQDGFIDRTFNGHFDGDNHTISGIRMSTTSTNNTGKHIGLFGHITSSAEVKNVILTNTVFKGYEHIAGIVGYNEGTVTNCQVASDVTIDGSDKFGGIVGENTGTVSFCTSSAKITHDRNDTGTMMVYHFYGGIVGYNSGTMNDNFAMGVRISVKSDHRYGVITATNKGTLARNYYFNCTVGNNTNVTGKGCYDGDITANDGATLYTNTYYTDANGTMVENVTAIPLHSIMTSLPAGTYVVNQDVTFTAPVTLNGDITLILADGCTMTIDDATGSAIGLNGKISDGVFHGLTVYGQTEQTGTLVVTDGSTTSIGADATYNGGIIHATSIGGSSITINRGTIGPVANSSTVVATNLVINGGVVNAQLTVTMGNITINGGQISTPDTGLGIMIMRGTLTLGCSNYSDFIYANKYTILSSTVVVKEGQTLTDGTNLYTGTLTTAQLNDLANKTLRLGVYREIEGYDDSDGGYVLIATPFVSVDPANVAGMTDDEFDLYRFNQAANLEWENWKQEEGDHYHFNLVSGTGYLYAHETDVTLIFTGEPYSGNGEITLSKTSGVGFEGWNLVGNPFTDTAYIDRPFYVMNSNGTEIIAAADAEQNSIAPMEGVFVEANSDGETITFTTAPQAPQKGGVILNLSKGRGVIDRAIVRFGEGRQLTKFQLRDNSTKIYIPQMGEDFAVVNAETQGEMPVNFKANENGVYTFTVSESLTFSYLHLIDNLTGADINLLQNPSYSFEARTDDYASRFKLVFATGEAHDESFAFISDGQIILTGINGNSLLQIIDVTGRVMATYNASSRIGTDGLAAGVYVLRLIQGENVKTQKMIIK